MRIFFKNIISEVIKSNKSVSVIFMAFYLYGILFYGMLFSPPWPQKFHSVPKSHGTYLLALTTCFQKKALWDMDPSQAKITSPNWPHVDWKVQLSISEKPLELSLFDPITTTCATNIIPYPMGNPPGNRIISFLNSQNHFFPDTWRHNDVKWSFWPDIAHLSSFDPITTTFDTNIISFSIGNSSRKLRIL